MTCINKNSVEYQTLLKKSGIPEIIVEAYSKEYLEKYGRFPYLDELPNSNSKNNLKTELKIKENGSSKISDILNYSGTSSIQEAVVKINDQHRDLETEIIPIVNEAIVNITHKPNEYNFNESEIEQDQKIDSYQVIDNAIHKLSNLYGIKINNTSDEELNSDKWNVLIPDSKLVNAFIYNGEIYVNLDRADVDAPIHEMFHIFVGSLRFTNPDLYQEIINSIEQLPDYNILAQSYSDRSQNDINEEIFVSEISKYLSGVTSSLEGIDPKLRYEITYNIKRILDSVLMGESSVKSISENRLYNMSLRELATELNSKVMINNFKGTINVEGSELHRKLNNIKSDLIKNKTLEQQCN